VSDGMPLVSGSAALLPFFIVYSSGSDRAF
jgi:hypothetical protein